MYSPVKNDDGKLERKFVVTQIKKLRREWQNAVGKGTRLEDVRGSVGMLLTDICQALDLNTDERIEALGQL